MTHNIILPIINGPTELGAELLKIIEEGQAHHSEGRFDEAEKFYREVIARYPTHERAHAMLAVLEYSRYPDDVDVRRASIKILEEMAARDPNDVIIISNLTMMLMRDERLVSAVEAGIKTMEAWPGHPYAYVTISSALSETFRHDVALYGLLYAAKQNPESRETLGQYIFIWDLNTGINPQIVHENRRIYNDRYIKPTMDLYPANYTNSTDLNRKIKVGYISSDFFMHSAFSTFCQMLCRFDTDRFEVYAYGSVVKEDSTTDFIRESVSVYRDVNHMTDEEITQLVKDDGIDILVDLSGFTKGTHLEVFARRAAPVQVSGWGYATGMSLDCFDYFFGDDMTVLPEDEQYFTEKIYRLPCTLSWVPPGEDIAVSPSMAIYGRPFTFGAFNRFHKITRNTFEVWCEILRRSPHSRLLLKSGVCGNPELSAFIKEEFIKEGVYYYQDMVDEDGNPIPRINMLSATDHGTHLAAHWRVDLMLDPFPHGNGVSAFESLWMGVPLLTLYGKTVPGRITSKILNNLGLDDLITHTSDEYIERAVHFSHSPTDLTVYRNDLRDKLLSSNMIIPEQYVHAVEEGYDRMMQEWVKSQESASVVE